jgi:hypothetical protein
MVLATGIRLALVLVVVLVLEKCVMECWSDGVLE